jgi:hypothetical protein
MWCQSFYYSSCVLYDIVFWVCCVPRVIQLLFSLYYQKEARSFHFRRYFTACVVKQVPMLKFTSFAAVLLLLASSADAFVKPAFTGSNAVNTSSTQVRVFGFLNEGKKALVKKLAGEYDEVAIKARMQGLIDDNSVLMFSFIK